LLRREGAEGWALGQVDCTVGGNTFRPLASLAALPERFEELG
jgi:hypothetical protein